MPPILRSAQFNDLGKIKSLYLAVTARPHGLARTPEEIDDFYIKDFLTNSLEQGLIWVLEQENELWGEIHGYTLSPAIFRHTLTNVTFVIHPDFQNQGLGRMLFSRFMEEIKTTMPTIERVELITQENNWSAIHLYESFGFAREGVMKRRIWKDGAFANDTLYAWLR